MANKRLTECERRIRELRDALFHIHQLTPPHLDECKKLAWDALNKDGCRNG
jgi:hypothetical protein